jgi:Protein of unknown function (DUF3618)
MARESEQLEQEADQARAQLSLTLEDLRARMTPGQVVDSIFEYTREGPPAEFLSNLGREIRDNPLPLLDRHWDRLANGPEQSVCTSILASTADTAAKRAGGDRRGYNSCRKQDQRAGATDSGARGRPDERYGKPGHPQRQGSGGRRRPQGGANNRDYTRRERRPLDRRAASSICVRRSRSEWRIGESIAPSNEEMQPQRRWEHARTVELNRERR